MSTFKVICKIKNPADWQRVKPDIKIVNTSKFFGLIKSSKIVSTPDKVPGPDRDEICIVKNEYLSEGEKYYILAGYPYGGYPAKYFIRLDEFKETQKEIAEKSQPALN